MSQIKISSINWGKIIIHDDPTKYHDVLIYNNKVEEREYERLKSLFGTGHKIGDWEIEKLVSNKPNVIIIGTGWMGIVELPEELKIKAEKKGIILKPLKSPKAAKEYNKLIEEGKKVNALIHSTC